MTTVPPDDDRLTAPDRDPQPRLLIHVPVVHAQVDMGSSAEGLRKIYIERKGLAAWEESRRATERFWKALEEKITSLDLDFGRVRLYQDGLPVCGHEIQVVRELASKGSPNYRILAALMDRGATLEGTEDSELLLKEYRLLEAGVGSPPAPAAGISSQAANASASANILEARDRYIAARIDQTLRPGEIGILFLGALHRVVELLPETIKVMALDEFIHAHGGSGRKAQP